MRAVPSILATAITTLLLGCSDGTGPSVVTPPDDPPPPPPPGVQEPPASFAVSPSHARLTAGETLQLTSHYTGNASAADGTVSVTWFSTDETVAIVSPGGLVRAIRGGQARIVAVLGLYRANTAITVVGLMKKHQAPLVCLSRFPAPDAPLTRKC